MAHIHFDLCEKRLLKCIVCIVQLKCSVQRLKYHTAYLPNEINLSVLIITYYVRDRQFLPSLGGGAADANLAVVVGAGPGVRVGVAPPGGAGGVWPCLGFVFHRGGVGDVRLYSGGHLLLWFDVLGGHLLLRFGGLVR